MQIVLVDNNSPDDSTDYFLSHYKGPARITAIKEKRPGTSWARRAGFKACENEYIAFVDDDNWVAEDWALKGFEFMDSHPDAGGVGSLNTAVSEASIPNWYQRYEGSYAVGPQKIKENPSKNDVQLIWGAGCFLRKSAVDQALVLNIEPLVSSRAGKGLLSGDDSELFLLMQYFGWRFYYDPGIQIQHSMDKERLTWEYFLQFKEGTGRTAVYMDLHRRLLQAYLDEKEFPDYDWECELKRAKKRLISDLPALAIKSLKLMPGNFRVAQASFNLGNYRERLQEKEKISSIYDSVRTKLTKNLPKPGKFE